MSGGSPPPPPVLEDPGNDAPAITYHGKQLSAQLTEASNSSGRMADRVLASLLLTKTLAVDLGPRLSTALVAASNCISKGTGSLDTTGIGWVSSTFTNCDTGNGIKWTGKIIYRSLTPPAGAFAQTTWTFPSMTIVMNDVTYTMSGSVRSVVSGDSSAKLTGDYVVQQGSNGPQFMTLGFEVDAQPPSSPASASLVGCVYESTLGFVVLTTAAPITLDASNTTMQRGGPVRAEGGSSSVWLAPLTAKLIALDLDTEGRPVASKSVLLNSRTSFEAQLSEPATASFGAAAGPDQTLDDDQPYRLNGHFSGADSHAWMDYNWEFIVSPPGSEALLSNAQSPTPTLRPDRPGAYTLALTSSDGLHVTRDSVSFTVPFPGDNLGLDPPAGRIASIGPYLGPDIEAPLAPPSLAAASTAFSTWDSFSDPNLFNYVLAEPGGKIVVSSHTAPNVSLPTFALDRPGFYEQKLWTSFDDDVYAHRYIAKDVPLSYFRATGFRALGTGHGIAAADLSGSGRTDIVTTGEKIVSGGNEKTVGVYRSIGPGRYLTPEYIAAGNGGAVVLGDFNNDGKLDIAAEAELTGIDIISQQSDGTWSAPQRLQPAAASCNSDSLEARPLVTADFNSDGRADLALIYRCAGMAMVVFFQNSDGTFSEHDVPVAEEPQTLLAADVTGDGKPDIVTVTPPPSSSLPAHVDVYPYTGSNSFGAAVTRAIPDSTHGGSYTGAVGDYDGDGFADLVVASSDGYYFYRQTGGGLASASLLAPFAKPLWADDFTDKSQFQAAEIRLQDLDGDGRLDLVTRSGSGGELAFLFHQSNGSLGAANVVFAAAGAQGAYTLPLFFDANGDGLTDIVYRGSVAPDHGEPGVLFAIRR